MRMFTQTEHTALKTGAKARLVCNTQNITMSECEDGPTLAKEGETWTGSSSDDSWSKDNCVPALTAVCSVCVNMHFRTWGSCLNSF